jgi:YHS domain-containing protein
MIGWALRIILFLIVLRLVLRFVRGLFQGLAPEPRTRRAETPVPLVRDPVCGIHIPMTRALTTGAGDHIQYFCSEECRRAWAARAS